MWCALWRCHCFNLHMPYSRGIGDRFLLYSWCRSLQCHEHAIYFAARVAHGVCMSPSAHTMNCHVSASDLCCLPGCSWAQCCLSISCSRTAAL